MTTSFNNTWFRWGHSVPCKAISLLFFACKSSEQTSGQKWCWLSIWRLQMATLIFLRSLFGLVWVTILTLSLLGLMNTFTFIWHPSASCSQTRKCGQSFRVYQMLLFVKVTSNSVDGFEASVTAVAYIPEFTQFVLKHLESIQRLIKLKSIKMQIILVNCIYIYSLQKPDFIWLLINNAWSN